MGTIACRELQIAREEVPSEKLRAGVRAPRPVPSGRVGPRRLQRTDRLPCRGDGGRRSAGARVRGTVAGVKSASQEPSGVHHGRGSVRVRLRGRGALGLLEVGVRRAVAVDQLSAQVPVRMAAASVTSEIASAAARALQAPALPPARPRAALPVLAAPIRAPVGGSLVRVHRVVVVGAPARRAPPGRASGLVREPGGCHQQRLQEHDHGPGERRSPSRSGREPQDQGREERS